LGSAATWSAAVTVSNVPTGAKAAYCFALRNAQTNPDALVFAAASGMTLDTAAGFQYKYPGVHTDIAGYGSNMVIIPLDSNKQFKWATVGGTGTTRVGPAVGYFI